MFRGSKWRKPINFGHVFYDLHTCLTTAFELKATFQKLSN